MKERVKQYIATHPVQSHAVVAAATAAAVAYGGPAAGAQVPKVIAILCAVLGVC